MADKYEGQDSVYGLVTGWAGEFTGQGKDGVRKRRLHRRVAVQQLAHQPLLTELMTEEQNLGKSNVACYKMSGKSKLIYLQTAARMAYWKPPYSQGF